MILRGHKRGVWSGVFSPVDQVGLGRGGRGGNTVGVVLETFPCLCPLMTLITKA